MNLRIVAAVVGMGASAGLTYGPSRGFSESAVSDLTEASDSSDEVWAGFELNKAAFGGESPIEAPLMVTLMERGRNLSDSGNAQTAPEPATLAALGVGAIVLFARKRRRS